MPDILERDRRTMPYWAGGSHRELRGVPRAALSCEVFYTSLSGQGQGTTGNVSKSGCLIEGDLCPREGDKLTLVLHRPTCPDLIVVDKARVVWTNGRKFGVAHETVYPSELARLNTLLTREQSA